MPRSFAPQSPLAFYSSEEVEKICAAGRTRPYEPGEVIFRRGDPGETMYLVLEGQIDLNFGEGKPPKALGPGDFFGELSLFTPQPRTATALTRGLSILCELDQNAVDVLSGVQPLLLVRFLRRTCAYLVASEQQLVREMERKNRELQDTLDYLRRTFEELTHQELLAHTDELTGLYNRRCLAIQIDKFTDRARVSGTDLALIALDLDGLKPINDTLGHAQGDELLRQVGAVLKRVVRKSDLPCRVGGDEFSVLLADINAEQARARAEEIRRSIENLAYESAVPMPKVTASLGVTMWQGGDSPEGFLERADRYLYQAKSNGRNCICWMGHLLRPGPAAVEGT